MINDENSKIKLLNDLPVGQQENEDEFQHKVYADILRDVFQSNRPGISVGLFGNWGQGKSTIVNLLEQNPPNDTKIVVFNAWKVRGDSFRKQLILSILELLDPDEAKRYKECIGIADIKALWAKQERNRNSQWWQIVNNILKECWRDKHVVRIQLVLIVSVLILFGIIFGVGLMWPPFINLANAGFSAMGMTLILVAVGLLWRKYLTVIGIPEATTEGQLLKYPEQFRDVFVRQIDRFCCKQKKRLIVVIDDLDRCEPETVVQALSAIRQFADQSEILGAEATKQPGPGCQFLIPCDELQTVLALETDGYCSNDDKKGYHDYQNELLRKFFDVVVRMDKLLPQDLVTYAESLVKNGHIDLDPEDAKQIVAVVNPRDPRQVKKLLNALRLAQEKVTRYYQSGLLPKPAEMPQFTPTLIALTALRETVPSVYNEICHDVGLIESLLSVSEQHGESDEHKKAKQILLLAGYVSPITANLLITCRWDQKLSGLQNGPAFIYAVGDFNETKFKEILHNAPVDERNKLLDVLKTEITTNIRTPAQLRKIILLLGSYASIGGEHEEAVIPLVDKCLSFPGNQQFLNEVLDNLPRLDWLAQQMSKLQEKERTFKIVLSNFDKEPKTRDHELRFLLHNPLLMSKELQRRFNTTLDKMLFEINDQEWLSTTERIARLLPSDMTHCFGFAPEVALKMIGRKWCDDESSKAKDPSQWPTPKIAKAMIGNDNKQMAYQCLTKLFENNGKLHSPIKLTPDTVSIRPLWVFVAYLMSAIQPESASKFYDYFMQWLLVQASKDEVLLVLDGIKTQMLSFTDPQVERLGRQLCDILNQHISETWILDYITSKPSDNSLVLKWNKLCHAFFLRFKEITILTAGFPEWYKQVLAKAQKDEWSVGEIADALLAYKLQTDQNVDAWLPMLQPILNGCYTKTKDEVLKLLRSRSNVSVLKVGATLVWKQPMESAEIDEHARPLADILLNLSPDALKSILDKNDLLNNNISKSLIEAMIARLPDNDDLLFQKKELLTFIVQGNALIENECRQDFRRRVKRLEKSSNDKHKEIGDQIINIMDSPAPKPER